MNSSVTTVSFGFGFFFNTTNEHRHTAGITHFSQNTFHIQTLENSCIFSCLQICCMSMKLLVCQPFIFLMILTFVRGTSGQRNAFCAAGTVLHYQHGKKDSHWFQCCWMRPLEHTKSFTVNVFVTYIFLNK